MEYFAGRQERKGKGIGKIEWNLNSHPSIHHVMHACMNLYIYMLSSWIHQILQCKWQTFLPSFSSFWSAKQIMSTCIMYALRTEPSKLCALWNFYVYRQPFKLNTHFFIDGYQATRLILNSRLSIWFFCSNIVSSGCIWNEFFSHWTHADSTRD